MYVDLYDKDGSSKAIAAFLKAGLTERKVVFLYGVIGDMDSVVLAFKKDEVEEEEKQMEDTSILAKLETDGSIQLTLRILSP